MAEDMPDADVIGAHMMARLDALAAHSEPGEGLTRRFASAEHRAASALILGWMSDAGMAAHMDAVGNCVGRYEGLEPGLPALIMGSHQDSVRNGGRYDGMLGIVTPIACVAALNKRTERLPFAIEVLAFGDEEGVRFQSSLLGSRALAGAFDFEALERVDEDGITMRGAMQGFGLDPEAIGGLARKPEHVLAFVEVHIEQGPVLEAEGLALGVVTGISGADRLEVTLGGMAGHAGTVPMGQRSDALAAAAECILAVEAQAAAGDNTVGTVGMIAARPGAVNVIPGWVSFSVDLRSPDDAVRQGLVDNLRREFTAICARRGVTVEIENSHEGEAAACAPWLIEQISAAVAEEGITPRRLQSGAGHDGMAMDAITDIGMLFVRCQGGISHNPDEAITAADAGTAARALLRFIRAFQPPGETST
jgi:allantoate deiminase